MTGQAMTTLHPATLHLGYPTAIDPAQRDPLRDLSAGQRGPDHGRSPRAATGTAARSAHGRLIEIVRNRSATNTTAQWQARAAAR
jgi:hypothetical protein